MAADDGTSPLTPTARPPSTPATFTPAEPVLPSQVGLHNVRAVQAQAAAVYSGCADDGRTPVSPPWRGVVTAVDGRGEVAVAWDGRGVGRRALCRAHLYTALDDAAAAQCSVRRQPPIHRSPLTEGSLGDYWADTHTHTLAYLGFGGRVFYGRAFGGPLEDCDGSSTHGFSIDPPVPLADIVRRIASCNRSQEIVTHADRTHGPPDISGWPRWNDPIHQQSHVSAIRKAYQDKMRILVVSLVNNELLCEAEAALGIPAQYGHAGRCDDEYNILLQASAAKDMIAENQDWMELAVDAASVRGIVQRNKLAVVLHAEASDLFGQRLANEADAAWVARKLDVFGRVGIRSLQIVHEFNNDFAGAAAHVEALERGNDMGAGGGSSVSGTKENPYTLDSLVELDSSVPNYGTALPEDENGEIWKVLSNITSECPERLGDAVDALTRLTSRSSRGRKVWKSRPFKFGGKSNVYGLTDLGKELLKQLMDRRWIVDLAHLSREAGREAFAMMLPRNYPVFISHAAMMGPSTTGDFRVDETPLHWMAATGGMLGLMMPPADMPSYVSSTVPNDCHGSVKSFAQSYQAIRDLGIPVGLASDFNGLALNIAPRFGSINETCRGLYDRKCSRDAERASVTCGTLAAEAETQRAQQGAGTGTPYDVKGLGSFAEVGDMLRDMERVGADISTLRGSAESFIRLWERIENADRPVIDPSTVVSEELMQAYLVCSFWNSSGTLTKEDLSPATQQLSP